MIDLSIFSHSNSVSLGSLNRDQPCAAVKSWPASGTLLLPPTLFVPCLAVPCPFISAASTSLHAVLLLAAVVVQCIAERAEANKVRQRSPPLRGLRIRDSSRLQPSM
jgi:hypothetical protein